MNAPFQFPIRSISRAIFLLLVVTIAATGFAGNKYRTFSQSDLAEKKAKPGKALASQATFRFRNSTGQPVNDLHAKLNSHVTSVINADGFPVADISDKGKELELSGMTVAPGDSVTIVLGIDKKGPGTHVSRWWWTFNGSMVDSVRGRNEPVSIVQILSQPNGGNVLSHIYKHILKKERIVLVGIPTDTPDVGWIRYKKADRKFFPHSGEARCLDFIGTPSGHLRDLDGRLTNPHVKKHNNHLVGELHALKLAVIANDSGISEPLDTLATLFGDLLYDDTANPGSPIDNATIRGIIHRADSALTYCNHFTAGDYADLDSAIAKINAAFGGPYVALTFKPFVLAGSVDLASVPFLHENPSMPPVTRPLSGQSIVDEVPGSYAIAQNFPNPFNPVTTIEFELAEPSVVSLKVYNLLGAEVASLVHEQALDEGAQSVDFDANSMPSGVYLYRITARSIGDRPETFTALKKMILMK